MTHMRKISRGSWLAGVSGAALLSAAVLAAPAQAGPYNPISPPFAFEPTTNVPAAPNRHPGKEYSDELDRQGHPNNGVLDAKQNIMWDGNGGTADTFDYDGSDDERGVQVDALAHPFDYLFDEVVANTTAILFSTRSGANTQGAGSDFGLPAAGCAAGSPVCYETTGGAIGTWATKLQVNQTAPANPTNLDGLEIFGPEGADDATRFSLFGDPGGVAVFAYDPVTGSSVANVLTSDILDPLNTLLGTEFTADDLDVDALMQFGSEIMFSLWPIFDASGNLILPGDGVYVLDLTNSAISILNHGGHLWSEGWTAALNNGVAVNIDALESAAPEPVSLALLGLGLAGLGFATRRRAR